VLGDRRAPGGDYAQEDEEEEDDGNYAF